MRPIFLMLAVLLMACGDDASTSGGGGGEGGTTEEPPCSDIEAFIAGICVPAGVPFDKCGAGFEWNEGGCTPVLPEQPCLPGQVAFPGDTSCHDLKPCDGGKWGDAPIEASTTYVDASFTGASNGSEAAPFKTIKEATDAVSAGGVVAVAAGTYNEQVWLIKSTRIFGACPNTVIITGGTQNQSTVFLAGQNSELHDVSITSLNNDGLAVAAGNVIIDGVWIHDTVGTFGFGILDSNGPASISVRNTLVENVNNLGFFIGGSSVDAEQLIVRDLSPGMAGLGIGAVTSPNTGTPPILALRRSIVERVFGAGITSEAGTLDIAHTVIRDVATQPATGTDGEGLVVTEHPASGATATVNLDGVVIERTHTAGVALQAASGVIVNSSFRNILQSAPTRPDGLAIVVQVPPATLSVSLTLIDAATTAGILILDSPASINGVLVRNTAGGPDNLFGDGIVAMPINTPLASAEVRRSRVTNNARAGVTTFGGTLILSDDTLTCNVFDLAAEKSAAGALPTTTDEGNNVCGCEVFEHSCKAISIGLAPPSPDI